MVYKIKIFLIFTIYFFANNLKANIDPLSKITITSNKATCCKDKNDASNFIFKYIENVNITFADNSKIKSKELEIVIDYKSTKDKDKLDKNKKVVKDKQNTKISNSKKQSQIKKIIFNQGINLVSKNKIVDADTAEIYPESKICKLFGNVKIEQKKETPKDLPIITNCKQALLNLQTEELVLQGNEDNPVSTILQIEGKQGLLKKPKIKPAVAKTKKPKSKSMTEQTKN
ncbi:hypothetical protein K9L05_02380 [Candidatus Babeliales bacterium]|nr:hypothetical protein [Candidatus Babeliales bacterium]MCF7899473.1 hypothetical protein [Candidatus Babeliales bacterium]